MKMRTRAWPGAAAIVLSERVTPGRLTIPLITLPSFLLHGVRSFPVPKLRSRNRPAAVDFAPDSESAILNMVKAPSTSGKEKVKKPRLRYNSHDLESKSS